ncbi:MAG: hypothetical protein LC789_06405 [Actinobacteria bacterium]|nr:hypothetical protein [Actinomycetota bacterium]MCA1720443.1 hypothetical protein [Actinomycetota bacterium]
MSGFPRTLREVYRRPAWATGQNRRWYAKALYPGADMPLWVVGLLTVGIVWGAVTSLIEPAQDRAYWRLAFWALVGPPQAVRYVIDFLGLVRKRPEAGPQAPAPAPPSGA